MLRLTSFTIAAASFIASISLAPVAADFQPGSSGRVMWDSNCDFPGNDYRALKGSSEICGDLCAADLTCTHWSWNNYNGGTCWFKTNTRFTMATSSGAICGYVVSRTATSTSTSGLSIADTADMLGRINSVRAENGLGALTIDYRLVKAALLHSQDQASHCVMTHTGTTIPNFGDRIKAQGYTYGTAAENVAAGQATVADVMNSWLNSPATVPISSTRMWFKSALPWPRTEAAATTAPIGRRISGVLCIERSYLVHVDYYQDQY